MKKSDVLKFFGGTSKTAKALNITHASISQWGDDVPPLRAYQIERITFGKLKVDEAKDTQAND